MLRAVFFYAEFNQCFPDFFFLLIAKVDVRRCIKFIKAAESTDSLSDSMAGLGKSADTAKKKLADIDTLNVFDSDSSTGSVDFSAIVDGAESAQDSIAGLTDDLAGVTGDLDELSEKTNSFSLDGLTKNFGDTFKDIRTGFATFLDGFNFNSDTQLDSLRVLDSKVRELFGDDWSDFWTGVGSTMYRAFGENNSEYDRYMALTDIQNWLSAFDGMALFDVEATERSGTLYDLVCGACSAAGVSFGMTQAEFEALPNAAQTAKINTARIQTERDLLMYVGMMTASFARISRSNELEFVPLTCERNDGGVIVPVREIAGNIRFNTDFSDDTTCIAKLFTRRNGAAVYSTREISAGGSEKLAVMELNENPLLAELSDDEVAAVLNNELLQMYKCLNRVFDSSFTGDPALEIGDYVRLRGGAIDTDRGYATGIYHQNKGGAFRLRPDSP